MQPKIPVVELLRVSTADQAEDDRGGLPRQQEANRLTIERHGLDVIYQVRLVDVSGASTLAAPEIQEMIGLIQSGQAQGLVMADLDRLLRPDDWTSFGIFQPIKEAGALLYLPDQVIDLNTQAGFLMSGLQSVIAGNELAQFKKRVQGAKEEKRRQGKCPHSHICLPTGVGYERDTETWHYTPEAERVRDIFKLFLSGEHNLREIARKTGLHHKTVGNLLRNQIYIGWKLYDSKRGPKRRLRSDGRQADRRKVARAENEIIRVKVIDNPLIDPGDFWRIQEILTEKRTGFTERRQDSDELFLLKGLLRCSVCGEPMYTVPGGKAGHQKDYYYCRRKSSHYRKKGEYCPSGFMKRRVVEDTVMEFIGQQLASPEYIVGHVSRLFSGGIEAKRKIERQEVQQSLTKLGKARKRSLELYTDGLLERDELDVKIVQITAERTRLESKLEALSSDTTASQSDIEDVAVRTAQAFALFPFWDAEYQRQFLKAENPQFWVGKDGIVQFSLPVGLKLAQQAGRGSWRPRA